MDREKVIKGLELCTDISPNSCMMLCPYRNEQDGTYFGFCEQVLKRDALDLLREQEEKIRQLRLALQILNGNGVKVDTDGR